MPVAIPEQEQMPGKETLKSRYEAVMARVDAAARLSGRTGKDVMVVAVTKHASIDQIRELIRLGHVDLGENREQILSQHLAQVSEFLVRQRELPSTRQQPPPEDVRWHFIGHLQRNKVKKVIGSVRLIHTVDSLRLAEELQQFAAAKLDHPVEILIQVNVSGERTKHGIAPAATRHLIEQIETMYTLRVRGVMCMGPLTDDQDQIRRVFDRGFELFDDIRTSADKSRFNILSMGMSGDFEHAVAAGANMVRVGSAIFGNSEAE